MAYRVEFTKRAYESLAKLPAHILIKLKTWVSQVELVGLSEARKRTAFHDEPLKGKRVGQRSIRLNKAYRAIYVESYDGIVHILTIIEVNKHAY